MTRDRLKRIYDLHAWTGVIAGLFIYIVSLSGVFALFGEELLVWEDETRRIALPEAPLAAMPLVEGLVEELPGELRGLSLHFPSPLHPFYSASAQVLTPEGAFETHQRRWHPESGAALPERGAGLSHWLVDFHRNLMLPRTWGRALVGLAGILLFLSLVSGLVIHRKMLTELFQWRLDRSVRLKWQDSHKALGLWGLPFHAVIALTGAWLGFVVLLLPLTAAVSTQGDIGAVIATVMGEQPQPSGTAGPPLSIDEARAAVEAKLGDAADSLTVFNWGDRDAVYRFTFHPDDRLTAHGHIDLAAADGSLSEPRFGQNPGLTYRVLPAVTSLHYGDFGGPWLKLLYALLGLALCVLTVTGTMMWLERRLHGHAGGGSPLAYRALSRLLLGVSAGMGLASIAIFYADKLVATAEERRIDMIGTVYFAVWGLGLLYGCLRSNEYRACKELLAATGLACLGLPLLNGIAGGDAFWELLSRGESYAAGCDLAALGLGIALLLVSLRLPSSRPAGKRPRKAPEGSVADA